MYFYEKLYKLRKEINITQEALAERLDVSRQAVSKWETGQAMPEVEKIIELAKIFSVSIDSLLIDCENKDEEMVETNLQKTSFRQTSVSARIIAACVLSGIGFIGVLIFYIVYVLKEKTASFFEFIEYYKAEVLIIFFFLLMGTGCILLIKNYITRIFQAFCRQTPIFKLGTGLFLVGLICSFMSILFLLNFSATIATSRRIDSITQNVISEDIRIYPNQPFLPIFLIILSLVITLTGIVIITIERIKKRRSKRICENKRNL